MSSTDLIGKVSERSVWKKWVLGPAWNWLRLMDGEQRWVGDNWSCNEEAPPELSASTPCPPKKHVTTFYPRDAMLARVIEIATCLSVCLSVRPSVTRRYCVKTKNASGMISSPSDSPKTLVFWRQISSPNSKGFPPNGALKQGSVGKIQRFFSFKRLYLENGSRYGQGYY